jgi:maltose O-acetyltransferase
MSWQILLRRSAAQPGVAARVAMSLARGHYYRLKFRLLGRRVRIGRNFRVVGRLDIRGPGTVVFGDNCTVISSYLSPTTPYTHSREAVITFGNRVLLTGTRLGCSKRIDVGEGSGLAESRVMDTDFHSMKQTDGPRYNSSGMAQPVIIGRNVWVAVSAIVLKGVTIGDNSVVGAGAVVMQSVQPNTVVFGNPARVVWRLPEPPSAPPLADMMLPPAPASAAVPV